MLKRRTDLALEAAQLWQESAGEAGTLPGVESEESTREGYPVTTVRIRDEAGARALGKPVGTYVTLELDLKKAAKAVGEKYIAMVHVSEINGLTGYVRGGCSPVGMKKLYPTVFHASALEHEVIMVSAGKIGWQVALAPQALMDLTRGKAADIIAG